MEDLKKAKTLRETKTLEDKAVDLSKLDCVILCGGLGTRLRPIISDRPKVLAKIREKTFIDILLENILSYQFKNIILCTGYMKEQIKNYFNNYQENNNIIFSEEEIPLGTGGALKNSKSLVKSNHFFVLNGDSICETDLKKFYNFHKNKNTILSMVLSELNPNQSKKDYGNVKLDNLQRIIDFDEKSSNDIDNDNNNFGIGSNIIFLINAGIYLMKRDIFSFMPVKEKFSLEKDFFPNIIKYHKCYGFLTDKEVIDIGTPDRYRKVLESYQI